MKHVLLIVIMALISIKTFAAEKIRLTHSLCVERIECWAPEYLTVTCNYNNKLFLSAPSTLKVLSVITEINGRSTEFMDVEEFYDILDANTNISLTYLTKINGENKMFSEELKKLAGMPVIENIPSETIVGKKSWHQSPDFYFLYPHKIDEYRYSDERSQWFQNSVFAEKNLVDKNTIVNDIEIDYFSFNTYDYAYNESIEELEQKQLLKEFASILKSRGMKKVEKNPDVYLYVTVQSDLSIETVYMPKQVTNYQANGYGRISYGYYSNYSHGSVHSQTITEEQGKMKSFTKNDVYLQITILDAKRMDNLQPPKIWQYTYLDRIDNNMTASVFLEKIRDYSIIYPFYPEYKFHWNSNGSYSWEQEISYLGFNVDKNYIITGCVPNSFAEKYKISPGCQMVLQEKEIGYKDKGLYLCKNYNRYNEKQNKLYLIKKIGNKKIKGEMLKNCERIIVSSKEFFIDKEQ